MVGGELTLCLQQGIEPPGPQCLHAAGGEGSAEEWPVGIDEAQNPMDCDIVVQEFADGVGLFADPVDESRAVRLRPRDERVR